MQDNLEFLQWTKRFWDQYYPGGDYDALARRKASGAPAAPPMAAPARTSGAGAARRGTTPTTTAPRPTRAIGGGTGGSALTQENAQLKESVVGLERERDFYFSKLRDIELLIQHAIELDPTIEEDEEGLVKKIQGILYSTEVYSCYVTRNNKRTNLATRTVSRSHLKEMPCRRTTRKHFSETRVSTIWR
jgi:RP/EB family microtubule-associated protein